MIVNDLELDKPTLYYRYREGRKLIEKREVFWPYYFSEEDKGKGSATTIDGKIVYKSYYPKSYYRYFLQKKLHNSYEVDVSMENLFLRDNFKTLPEYELRVLHLDIETDMGIDALRAEKAITAITFWDSYTNEYVTLSWKVGLSEAELQEIQDFFTDENHTVVIFENEKTMVKDFLAMFKEINPDLITGWFVIDYDIQYIMNRMYRLGINASELSPVRQIESNITYKVKTPIKGRISFDLMKGYAKLHDGDIGSQSLRAVLEDNDAPIQKLYGMEDYDSDYLSFLEYSLVDVKGTVWIDQKFDIVNTFIERQRLAGCVFTDTTYNKDMVDMAHLKKAREMGIVLPTGRFHTKVPYEGAIVIEPEPGLYKNVIIMDYKSLYPSAMEAANMSYETKDINGDIKLGNGVSFKSSPPGLTASLLGDIQVKREYYIGERDKYPKGSSDWNKWDNKQRTTKFLKNSFYGWCGYSGSRLYDPDIAASITWLSRQALTHSIEHLKEHYPGFEVIYGHTDSVFIQVPGDMDYDELKELSEEIKISINESMHMLDEKYNLIPGKFKIDVEQCMTALLLVGKNRYCGMYPVEDGFRYKIQGFEVKKKLTSIVMKEIQGSVIKHILHEDDKEIIFSEVKEIVKGLRENTYPIEDICIKKKIKKPIKKYKVKSDHIKAAEWSNEFLHTNFGKEGDVVNMIIVMMDEEAEKLSVKDDCVIGFENTDQIKNLTVDADSMIEKMIPGKLENIFIAMGWNLDELLTSKRIRSANKW